jgi:hypothetical protein
MKLATIELSVDEAQQRFEEYRQAVRERHDEEDRMIMRGFQALAKGTTVLHLPRTIKAGGVQTLRIPKRWERNKTIDVTVPRLAIARANRTTVWTRGVTSDGACVMQTKRDPHVNNNFDLTRFPAGTFDEGTEDSIGSWGSPRIRAIVPNVPPRLRPRASLGNYHILFEAEWGLDPEPPVDPALLRHIGGDLYALVAIWDLTEIERAVLTGTR